MSYRPVRPTFSAPTHIPRHSVPRQLWGDDVAGEVADIVYVSNDKVHQLVFEMPPGGAFRHSDEFRTVFDTDEVYYVLSGNLIMNNPETGEMYRVLAGEAIFFRKETWHYGFSIGLEPVRVLEFIAPPPATGSTQAYARTKTDLIAPKYGRNDLIGRWPMALPEARESSTMHVLREGDLLWRLEGDDRPVLVGILASTERLTVGKIFLQPGQKSYVETHGGDECLYVLEGNAGIRLPDESGQSFFNLEIEDGFYIPEAISHQYYNFSSRLAVLMFIVAPDYLKPSGA